MQSFRLFCLFLAAFFAPSVSRAQVLINEYSCANLTAYYDSFNKSEDWIELYNAGNATVNVSGYFLSDDADEPTKWSFPVGTAIPPQGHLTVWASGRDVAVSGELHTNFKLTQTKNNPEVLTLSAPDGTTVLDQIEIKRTKKNASRGRISDGNATWGIFPEATLGAANAASIWYRSFADRPSFNWDSGFYPAAISVTIENNADPLTTQIRYTLDGSEPTPSSPLYTGPVTIGQTRVLKAVAFSSEPDVLPSFMEFSTYFINESHSLVVISVGSDGIQELANGNQSLRPEGSVEYFDKNGQRAARSYGEYNSHGQDSWVNAQRGLDLICRDEMGYSKGLKEKIFATSERDEFQRLIFRAAGDDNYPGTLPEHDGCANLRDAYVHNLADRGGLHLDKRRSEKAILYLNGDYWGVYDLRELPDDHDYTKFYYNQDKYDIQYLLTWGSTWAEYGGQQGLDDWDDLRAFISSNSMSNQANFDYVASQLDVNSLVDYVIVNSVTVCSDWLNYNTGWWRGFNPEGQHQKWYYTLWDNDATFAYYINYTGIADTSANALPCQVESLTQQWPDVNGHMRTLKKLRQNAEFDRYYKSRYIDLMNTVFSCDNMLSYLDTVANTIAPEMPRHIARWGGSYTAWQANVARLRNFIERRCVALTAGVAECYNLSGPYEVTFDVDPTDIGATMQVNSLEINEFPTTLNLFGGIAVRVETHHDPLLAPTYQFDQWETTVPLTTSFITNDTLALGFLSAGGADTVVAHYVQIISSVSPLPQGVAQATLGAAPTAFGDATTVTLDLPASAPVSLRLLAPTGREVANLATPTRPLAAGRHTFALRMPAGGYPAGVYLLQFQSGTQVQVVKLVYAP
jgi:hypothetical protein